MTDTTRRQNLETALFALAFVLAITVRLLRLGDMPLSDDEARWAMQALDLTRGLHPVIGPQPIYVLLTTLVFYVFQASNFTARFIPALAGALLAFAPLFFRDRLGNKAALVLSFVLALEPGLLNMSREAGSPIIALSAVIFTWAFWRAGKLRASGIAAGMALLSGMAVWPGLLGLALAYGLSRGLSRSSAADESAAPQPAFDRPSLVTAAAYAIGTYLALGSLFLIVPAGLGAGLAAIPAYLQGWLTFDDVPALRLAAALAFYEPLAVLLAVVGLVRGIRQGDKLVTSLGLWLLSALILSMVYSSRQVADLIWALIPLWALAVIEASRYLVAAQDNVWETLAMAALTVAILFFAGSNFVTIAISPLDMNAIAREIGSLQLTVGQGLTLAILVALALLAACVALVAYGWSKSVAFQGALWGALLAAAVYTLAISVAAANLRTYRTVELWQAGPRTMQAQVFIDQMNDLARWSKGVNQSLDASVSGLDSPALHWLLRDWSDVTYSPSPTLTGTPAFVIASDQLSAPELSSAYRGQNFNWRNYPNWNALAASDWLRWVILHQAPEGQDNIILWTRSDVFLDASNPIKAP
jgi:type II secretory pathway pseudopilin PulG